MVIQHYFFAILLVFPCSGQILTLRTYNYNNGGNSLTISRTNVTDFSKFSPGIMPDIKQICVYGLWITYSGVNYTGEPLPHPRNKNEWNKEEQCTDHDILREPIRSARYIIDDEGITLFSDINFGGKNFQFKGLADAALPFQPQSLLLRGSGTSWTLFSGTNFNGTCLCYANSNRITYQKVAKILDDVNSIAKGCLSKNSNSC